MTEREMMRKKAAARKERERKARNRRVVVTVALMLVVCIASIGGTIAWLTDSTEAVTNTFNPSNIGLTLSENSPTNYIANMIPGGTIYKDPKVTITNDVDAYLFVTVEESGDPDLDKYIGWAIEDGWNLLVSASGTADAQGDRDYYVYYREVTKDADKEYYILNDNTVSVHTSVTKADMEAIDITKPTMSFKAYTIQMENGNGTKFSVDEAWAQLTPSSGGGAPGEPEGGN